MLPEDETRPNAVVRRSLLLQAELGPSMPPILHRTLTGRNHAASHRAHFCQRPAGRLSFL